MKIQTINAVAVLIGVISSISAGMVAFIGDAGWVWVALVMALTFVITFTATKFSVSKFVIFKVKPIYQIVLSRNMKTQELEKQLLGEKRIEETMQNELGYWAETKQQEIDRLKENEQYRKEFLGNVSHEIKTPIFNIQGYILTLLDGGLEDPNINRKYLERAEKSVDRLINIVQDLEQISRLESGGLILNPEKFDIVALTRELAEGFEMLAGQRGIKIVVGSQGNPVLPVMVTADKKYIGQVLINLISNSIKYGNEGGTTEVKFIDMFDKIMVEVEDDGVGMAKDDIPRIFERFYRTDKSRSREMGGTGLGLAIVKHIIEAHNETISLRSEVGKGSTFSFTVSKN